MRFPHRPPLGRLSSYNGMIKPINGTITCLAACDQGELWRETCSTLQRDADIQAHCSVTCQDTRKLRVCRCQRVCVLRRLSDYTCLRFVGYHSIEIHLIKDIVLTPWFDKRARQTPKFMETQAAVDLLGWLTSSAG